MQLFPHQVEGIKFLKEKKRAILADEMGLGKTRQAIMAGGEDGNGTVLVVCPASLKINWYREIETVFPEDDIFVVESGPEKIIPEAHWVVINYDMLNKYKEQLKGKIERGDIGLAILDEAHYIKGKKTLRAENTLDIVNKLEKVYVLTGTPIMNRPIEMFNLLRAIKHPLGTRKTFYSTRYCQGHMEVIPRKNKPPIRYWDDTGASFLEELRELTKDSILRRKKADVLDLPAKIISVEVCEMTKEGKKAYDNAWDEYIDYIAQNPEGKDFENILSAQQLVELMKLKQVCSRHKIPKIVEDIERMVEAGEKVIVFSQFTSTIHTIAEEARKIKYDTGKSFLGKPIMKNIKVVTLTGQDDMKERQEAVDSFVNDEETKVIVLNIKAGGVGLNLTVASNVMFADMEWSPEIHAQAEDRAHRIGQTGTVNIYYYVLEDTIEEDIVDILEQKRIVIKKIMDGAGDDILNTNSVAGEFLKRLKKKLGTTH